MQEEDDLRGLAISFLFLAIHIYWFCYEWFAQTG